MWNYNFVAPNIILLFLIVIYYFTQPHLPVAKNSAFFKLLFLEIAVILSDYIASKCLDNFNSYPKIIHLILNVIYFVVFLSRSAAYFHFMAVIIIPKFKRTRGIQLATYSVLIGCAILAVANLFTPTLFRIDTDGYHRAFLYNSIYVCTFTYLILSFAVLLRNRKNLPRNHFLSILCYNLILLSGYLIRILLPTYLIMDFFCLIAIFIIFLSFENSTIYLEERTKAFNTKALISMLSEAIEKPELLLGVFIQNYNDMREIYSGEQLDEGLLLITNYLRKKYPKYHLFYIQNGMFILVGKDVNKSTSTIKIEIQERFSHDWFGQNKESELFLDVMFVEFADNFKITNARDIIRGFISAYNNQDSIKKDSLLITNDTLNLIDKNAVLKKTVKNAVKTKEVEMFLQPLVCSKTHKLIGAEALARIRDEDGNIIPPGLFIPVAEKNGYINLLGEIMFEKACEFVSKNNLEKLGMQWVNVNVSPLQFLRNDLSECFNTILEKYHVSADKIHLEITEEAMIDYSLLEKQIQNMKDIGFKFVLDDFGSGYSNVTRINRYPFINIKLDMEVVRNYFKNNEEILPSLVQSFKKSGFSITAEGIENLEMADGMQNLGCDFLQGFYFSKPLPADEFIEKYSN